MTIGERVISLLEGRGIQKNKLAAHLGTAASTINGWKNEGKNPKSEFIVPICAFLGVSEHFLLTGEEDTAQPARIAPAAFQGHIDPELLDLISQMSDREQIKLCERAQEILDRRQSDRGDSEAAV